MNEYQPCPKCGGRNFKVWKMPSPVIVHWVLNPGLAFNELVLGQRVPKVQLICQDCQDPFYNRSYVPCPHCQTMIHGRTWSKKNSFFNWLGYVCPCCGKRIPCLWNYTSLVILTITSPIWYLPYRLYFRDRIPKKPIPNPEPMKPVSKMTWLYMGAGWGVIMWLISSLAPVLKSIASGGNPHWNRVLLDIPLWTVGGTLFGGFMYLFMTKRKSRADK